MAAECVMVGQLLWDEDGPLVLCDPVDEKRMGHCFRIHASRIRWAGSVILQTTLLSLGPRKLDWGWRSGPAGLRDCVMVLGIYMHVFEPLTGDEVRMSTKEIEAALIKGDDENTKFHVGLLKVPGEDSGNDDPVSTRGL
ncbi:hypothetical protein Droror1_Dr00025824 [Drosera rotundifolia]